MSESENNNLIWQAESTHPELAEKLRQSLREVFDPELGLNIIQLGLIRDVLIGNDDVQIKMILTTPFCPYGTALIDMTRKKAEVVLEKPTHIELSMEMWDFSMMEDGATSDWGLY